MESYNWSRTGFDTKTSIPHPTLSFDLSVNGATVKVSRIGNDCKALVGGGGGGGGGDDSSPKVVGVPLHLHARELILSHPRTGAPLHVTAGRTSVTDLPLSY